MSWGILGCPGVIRLTDAEMHPEDEARMANSVSLIRLLLLEQSDLDLHCLTGPICPQYEEFIWDFRPSQMQNALTTCI